MYLYIDPSGSHSTYLVLFYPDHQKEYTYEGKNRELLTHIVHIFDQEKLSLDDLDGIAVRVGSGGFSSTRIAAVVANTFSFALHIPVIGSSGEHAHSFDILTSIFTSTKPGVYLSPTYSGEPNIGVPSHV